MDERIAKWLIDIKTAIEEIDFFTQNLSLTFQEYQSNLLIKRAVERDLEIIGEAINKILKKDASYAEKITSAKDIIGFRNIIVHAYDNISDENVWSILTYHFSY